MRLDAAGAFGFRTFDRFQLCVIVKTAVSHHTLYFFLTQAVLSSFGRENGIEYVLVSRNKTI